MATISERTLVYAIGSEEGPVKVGITNNLLSRLRSLQNGSATKLELIWVYTTWDRAVALRMEREFHEFHSDVRLEGEWFDVEAMLAFESLETQVQFMMDHSIAWFSNGGTLEDWCRVVYHDILENAHGDPKRLRELLAKFHEERRGN